MTALLLDTHVLIWTLFGTRALSKRAHDAIHRAIDAGHSLTISAITLVELEYLTEKSRIPGHMLPRVRQIVVEGKGRLTVVPVDVAVSAALHHVRRDLVPDMPDRIIAATAIALELPLLSADGAIHKCDLNVIW